MATSSERSPPPFPDSEDQELETEEPNVSAQDSDEGEDIFLGSDNPLEAKMDPAVPENELTEPSSGPIQEQASGIFSDPLTKHVSQTENVVSDQSANKMINELTDAVEVIKDMTGEVSGGADIFETPDERADMAEVTKDTTEEPGGNTEAAGDIYESFGDVSKKLNETTDPAELTKDETEQPTDNAEAASNIADVSEDIFEMPDEPTDVVEVELKKEELSLSVGAEAVRNTAELPQNINEGPGDIAEPLTGNSESAICTDYEQQIVIDKAVNEALSAPILDIFSDSVSDTEQPPKTGVIDPLSDHLMDVPVAEITAPVTNATSQSPRDLFDDEPSDLFAEPLLKNSGKKDVLPRDLTEEDEHSYLFTEPLVKNPVKQETNIFNEPDEDLFKDPIGGTSNKSLNVTFGEAPVEKPADAKAGGVSGPLSDGFMDDPADIFAEEGLVSLPPRVTSTANPKTNGVHSDEESDIFAEATVELSLDSPRNDRKNKETVVPSVSALSVSATASLPKPQTATPEELEEEESGDNFEINISITNPEKVGDGMNAYMGYKVSTQTTLPMFRSKTFTVRRRFSDFLGLYEKLCEKHASNGFIVPPPPEKSILGMTKVKVGKEDPSSAEFVERRRAALERYLQRVVCHPSLLQDPDVREFLEREELPRALSTQALSGAGFLKMISKATDAVSKMTIKMNESDVWFEEKLQEVEGEDQQLRKLHAMVDSLVNHRKELSVNTAGFAKSVAMLGSSEDNTALSRALSQLAEVEDKMEQLHQDQASNDSFTLAEMLADYIRLLGSVRASFDQRMRAWQRWQDAQNMLQKKRETEAKLLWANKPDKLQQAKEDIAEWEAKVTQYERDFDRVSATVRKEVLRFEKEKARDFKRLVVKYLEALLLSQQQLIKYWEAFLPEAKAIA